MSDSHRCAAWAGLHTTLCIVWGQYIAGMALRMLCAPQKGPACLLCIPLSAAAHSTSFNTLTPLQACH